MAVLKILRLSNAHNFRVLTQLVIDKTGELVHGGSVLGEAPLACQAKYTERGSKATREWIKDLLAGKRVEDRRVVHRFKAKRDREGEGPVVVLCYVACNF